MITKKDNFTTYHHVPITLGSLPEQGTEWWSDEDWKKHNDNVIKLQTSGDYGKIVHLDISILDNPMFDDCRMINTASLESHTLEIMDFGK